MQTRNQRLPVASPANQGGQGSSSHPQARVVDEHQQDEHVDDEQSNSAVSLDTNSTKRRNIVKTQKVESTSRQFLQLKPSSCSLLSGLCWKKKIEELYTCDLDIKTLTCNKLTHCLFDFDCQELNKPNEAERYQFQMFKIQNIKVTEEAARGEKESKDADGLDQSFN